MKLGLKKDEVKLYPYTTEWNTEYLKIKQQIKEATTINENHIEHIGSTAITDMIAKPIIDIMIGVEDIKNVDTFLIYKMLDFFVSEWKGQEKSYLRNLRMIHTKRKRILFI